MYFGAVFTIIFYTKQKTMKPIDVAAIEYMPVVSKILKKQERPGSTIALWVEGYKVQKTLIKSFESIKSLKIKVIKSYAEYKKHTSDKTYTDVELLIFVYPSEWKEWRQLTKSLPQNDKQIIYMIDNALSVAYWVDKIQRLNKDGTELVPITFCFD